MKRSSAYVPVAGDVVWISLDPQAGHEQARRRPALVLSPDSYNRKVGHGLVCPITNQVKGYPFEVMLPDGLPVKGAVLSDQVKSLDWRAREAKRICAAPATVHRSVLQLIQALLDAE